MFSSFRSTVEALAQAAERPKTPDQTGSPARRSTDLFASPSVLAESALTNLKKTLVTSHPSPQTPPRPTSAQSNVRRTPGMSLEDRLRATFTVGEVSRTTTPGTPASGAGASSPDEVDPLSVELPVSPSSDGNIGSERAASPPLEQQALPVPSISTALASNSASSDDPPLTASFVSVRSFVNLDDHPLSPGPPASPQPASSTQSSSPAILDHTNAASTSSPAPDEVHSPVVALSVPDEPVVAAAIVPTVQEDDPPIPLSAEAPMPESPMEADIATDASSPPAALPVSSPPEIASDHPAESVDMGEPPSMEISVQSSKEPEVDVEKLQARLKLVEQRFTGKTITFIRAPTHDSRRVNLF